MLVARNYAAKRGGKIKRQNGSERKRGLGVGRFSYQFNLHNSAAASGRLSRAIAAVFSPTRLALVSFEAWYIPVVSGLLITMKYVPRGEGNVYEQQEKYYPRKQ